MGALERLGKINKVPVGLLGFLGIKSSGRSPQDLQDSVVPIIDIFRQYVAAERVYLQENVNLTGLGAFGFSATNTVPPGEFWAMEYFAIRTATLTAGQTVRFSPAVLFEGQNAGALGDPAEATVGERAFGGYAPPGEIVLLPPGSNLYADVTRLAAGPIIATLWAKIARMPI